MTYSTPSRNSIETPTRILSCEPGLDRRTSTSGRCYPPCLYVGIFLRRVCVFRRCLQQQGYVLQDEATEEWNKLYDEGRYLLTDRYRDDTNRVVGEIKFLGDQFDQDPLNKAFGQSVKKLFEHLGHDSNGKIAFKAQLAKDFMSIVLPGIAEHVRYVPIPRIEVQDPMIDMVSYYPTPLLKHPSLTYFPQAIENLAVDSDNLFPNVVELSSDNYWRWGRRQISNKHDNQVCLSHQNTTKTPWVS